MPQFELLPMMLAPTSLLVLLAVEGAAPNVGTGTARPRPREVVVLYSGRGPDLDRVIAARLQGAPGGAHLVTENLDLASLNDEDYEKRLVGIMRRKYEGRPVDLVMPVMQPAIRFMVNHGEAAFPGVPVVLSVADDVRVKGLKIPTTMAGVLGHVVSLPTIQAALDLQPDVRRVVLVAGEAPSDQYWRERTREELRILEPRIEIVEPYGLAMPALLDWLRSLPAHTVVLFVLFTEDAAGSLYSTDAIHLVTDAASVPVYATFEQVLGSGVVGGYMFSPDREAEKAADVAVRVLGGARPEEIGVRVEESNTFVFDWRALRRWNLPESRLPKGSTVRFRPASAWTLYRGPIVGGLAVIALQAALLAGLLVQVRRRRRAEGELDERLRFETLLSDITRRLSRADTAELDAAIDDGLCRLAHALGGDRAELAQFMEGSPGFEITHAYRAHEDVPALPPVIEAVRLPWITERVKSGEIVRFNRLTELPPEAMDDRASMEDLGIRAKVLIPLSVGGAPLGVLGLGVLREWAWPDDLVRRLVLSAETFGAALMRRKFERLLAESQGFGAALFTSIHGQVAVLDRAGTIVAANEAWAMAARHDDVAFGTPHIGASYLEACRTTVRRGEVEAAAIVRGVTAVLDGTAPSFSAEYRIDGADGERWFELLAEPLLRREGGAVVTRVDHTDRRRAELEAGRSREELAHMNRVSTLGELAASLAHEMNQPLTAIRSNVQVAQRLMRSDSPDLDELREILTDLAHDEDRAGQVIRRLRALFQKGQRERVPLDANELIREVARLLQAEIVIRSASLRTYLNKGLPPIQGDRVQLQQVVLNLALNGLDAMRGLPAGERVLTIRSSLEEAELLIEVEDRGHGIAEADREYVFTPFFTTKATGMGMGLNIARSIVEAHGGSLSLTSKPGAGTSFYVRIPTGLVT